MTKFTKAFVTVGALFVSLFALSSCTNSFCSPSDKASLTANYAKENQEKILKQAKDSGLVIPGDEYWTYLDKKVEDAYTEIKTSIESNAIVENYVPVSYIKSHAEYLKSTDEEAKKKLVDVETLKGVIKFGGINLEGKGEVWLNFDKWTEEANASAELHDITPTDTFLRFYKQNINQGIGNAVTCLTPESGYYGPDENVYVEGKTWGQAFSEYGPIEGLLVYPIGYLIHAFSNFFGLGGGGQILSILFVTLIVRFVIVLLSFSTLSSQSKMSELQPELARIQAKYPNAQTNQYEKEKMAREQMILYKKYKIHPFRQILVMIIQFPIFIAVWGAMQGSAILTSGNVFGLSLATGTMKAMSSGTEEAPFAIILFLLMAVGQFFATMIPMWIQNYRKKRIVGTKTVKVQEDSMQSGMMKWMPIIMMVMIIFMGLSLPAAMGIYWFFGALISILQTILTEIYQSVKKGRGPKSDKKDRFVKAKKVKNNKKMALRRR